MLTIKNLRYVNKTSAFKISDTTTKIKLQGLLGSTPVTFQDADEVSIRIKNNSGYLMQVKPKILSDGIVSFSSKELELLPVGSYAMELWQDNQAGTNIYPSEGFLRFTINKNATEFKGDSMSTITLHDFEERIDKLEKDLRAKADNGDFDGEKGEPGDKGDPGKDATNNDPNAVHVSGNQAISGVKNFIDTPTINGNKVLDDSLQIGGRNYVHNGNFTDGVNGWTRFGDIDTYQIWFDGRLVYASNKAINGFTGAGQNNIPISGSKGDSITVSFDACYFGNNPSNYAKNINVIIHFNDNSGTIVGQETNSIDMTISVQRYSFTIKAPTDFSTVNVRFVYDSNTLYRNKLGRVKVEAGTKATDWTPAPEDIGTSQPIMSGNYGLRVTADGFQKTTDGGATWTTADI